jgi:hypothetical protein
MKTQNMIIVAFVILAIAIWSVGNGITTTEAIWPFDEVNSSQQGNQTGNQSMSMANPVSPSQSENPDY